MEPATVTTTAPDGTTETAVCEPDNYVLVVGPLMEITHEQVYANGTRIITIKRVGGAA